MKLKSRRRKYFLIEVIFVRSDIPIIDCDWLSSSKTLESLVKQHGIRDVGLRKIRK